MNRLLIVAAITASAYLYLSSPPEPPTSRLDTWDFHITTLWPDGRTTYTPASDEAACLDMAVERTLQGTSARCHSAPLPQDY